MNRFGGIVSIVHVSGPNRLLRLQVCDTFFDISRSPSATLTSHNIQTQCVFLGGMFFYHGTAEIKVKHFLEAGLN